MVKVIKKHIVCHRVTYGKQTTPYNKREYVGNFWGSPVATKEEWKKWAKNNGKTVEFKELPKKMIYIEQN